jgi:hypothetical protein
MLDCAGNLVPVKTAGNELNVLNNDYQFGTKNEVSVINYLEKYFRENITKSKDRYCAYDAFSENTKYEIKSRRNKYSTYPTTIVAVNKIRTTGRLVFVFHFTDGLYYIEYSEDTFSNFKVQNVSAIRKGGFKTETPHFFIPIDSLQRIEI